ncbi:MAG TPA: hypothetical protein VHF65_09040 [Nitrososphaera sp.]|nr:hypothetical protein [Nitrososphaera sp.]
MEEKEVASHHEKIITPYSIVTLFVPVVALVLVLAYGNILALNYLHVLTGGTWTGIDLFMGIVMGRILKGLDPPARTQVIKKLVPLMLFLMPALATVAITSGINLASQLGMLTFASPMIVAAAVIVIILSVQGFGIIMPTEIRIFLELRKKEPNKDKIIKWGMRNVKLAGSQGVFQVALIFIMANLALGFTLIPR